MKRVEREVAGELGRFADLLKGNVPCAWQALKKLLVDRVTFTPVEVENGKQTYTFKGELGHGALIRGAIYMHGDPSGTRTPDSLLKRPIEEEPQSGAG